jgi:ADP-ribosyltransferase exoenzyme
VNLRERAAIGAYTGEGYWEINGHLRHGDPKQRSPHIPHLDALLDTCEPSQGSIDVFRGVKQDYLDVLIAVGAQDGAIVEELGYISTTRRFDVAMQYAKLSNDDLVGILIKVTLPMGSRYLDIAAHSNFPDEEEILLPRGSTLRIGNYNPDERVLTVELCNG